MPQKFSSWSPTLLKQNSIVVVFLWIFFFSIGVFFHNYSRITGLQGKGEGISLIPHYHFHQLHRYLDIRRAISAESSPLHIGSSRTRTGFSYNPGVCFCHCSNYKFNEIIISDNQNNKIYFSLENKLLLQTINIFIPHNNWFNGYIWLWNIKHTHANAKTCSNSSKEKQYKIIF